MFPNQPNYTDSPKPSVVEPAETHARTMLVASCCVCRIPDEREDSRLWKFRYVKHRFDGNPFYCPDCNTALFYERIKR